MSKELEKIKAYVLEQTAELAENAKVDKIRLLTALWAWLTEEINKDLRLQVKRIKMLGRCKRTEHPSS